MGDVLLVTGELKLSAGLVAAQKLMYQSAISSHVEIGLGDGTFVHATTDGGVHIAFILDELAKCADSWRAIRLKGLNKEQEEEVAKATLHFLRQGYNHVYMGKGTDHSSFCSELVVKAYLKAGIEILGGRLPGKTTPAHFDMEADSGELWEDRRLPIFE
ncbi:MAG: hypothetical protein H7A05_06875 [Pseudomonadales bacterium]|nr:hypothetical protein [Pseudomonadales bacterium]